MISRVGFYFCLFMIPAWFAYSLWAALPAHAAEQCGTASWYRHGAVTANGEAFNPWGMTAAHKTLRFGTIVTVTRQDTGRSVTVRINDRGPAAWTGRIIDLSLGAATEIGMVEQGVVPVCLSWVSP